MFAAFTAGAGLSREEGTAYSYLMITQANGKGCTNILEVHS